MACKDCTIDFNTPPPKSLQDSRNVGLVIAGVAGGTAVLLSAICAPFVSPALRRVCLPYVPATTQQVENIFTGLKGRSGTLIDLGSGDGRIVIEAAKRGFKAHGVELNPWLVWFSKLNALRLGVRANASFQRKDIWKTPLGKYDNVVIFGVDSMMEELNIKFQKEMKLESAIAACRFSLPERKPDHVVGEGIDTVWIYFNSGKPKT
ncbi:hypothetical protein Ocin01_15925 [Orchesella cincta]|uniref:Methyltransferase domain-containing protein n=1 Tax=Orchesella cincta TaxID=48709 RepID=A0A1D2MCY0_ORCCI|nr:hypothetical protein Ocin01_15925 [Orchesella cincta]